MKTNPSAAELQEKAARKRKLDSALKQNMARRKAAAPAKRPAQSEAK